jgi:hypothetical protein
MNRLISTSFTAVLAAAAGPSLSQAPAKTPAVSHSSFYCDTSALTSEQRKRHFDVLGPALIAKRTAVRELPDGYEIQFPSDAQTYQQVAEYLDGERVCCPFFDIDLHVMPERGPLLVRFTGRPGSKQFIEADAAGWISPVGAGK